MSALIKPNHEQTGPSSQAKPVTNEPTTQDIKGWNVAKLLEWIKQKKPDLLRDEDIEKFETERISGRTFLKYAGNTDFFRNDCHLPPRTSSDLADLAKELADPATETNDRKSKYYLSYHASHADVHCPRWLRHAATPDICTLYFHFYRS
jgi:hypothetical protein